jgi:hypothetical protein
LISVDDRAMAFAGCMVVRLVSDHRTGIRDVPMSPSGDTRDSAIDARS